MKKKILAMMLLMNVSLVNMYTPVLSEAATFVDTKTEINASTIFWGEYEITTDGKIQKYNGKATEIEIPEKITTTMDGEIQEISITSICSTAFWGAYNAVSITIPASVSSISGGTFQRCDNLTTINVSPDNPYFKSIDGVVYSKSGDRLLICPPQKTKVTIENVTSIGNSAFEYCGKLTDITIPNSVKTIGYDAFSYCSGLTDITIPDSVTYIDTEAFQGCFNLKTLNLSSNVTYIGNNAFDYCYQLTKITIPESVTSIADSAFRYCTNLTDVVISSSVTSMGDFAFADCDKLTHITIPKSITYVPINTFMNSPESLTIHGYIGSAAETFAKENDINFVAIAEPTNTPMLTVEPTSTPAPTTEPTATPVPVKVSKLTLKQTTQNMYVGKSFTLTATVSPANATNKAVTYTSSKPSVATVNANGKVTAKSAGTTVITAKANDGSSSIATCTVNVGYKIIYKLNGGKNNKSNPSLYTKASNVKLAPPTKTGYTFDGWFTTKNFKSGSKITAISQKATGTKTVYAKWKKVVKPAKATLTRVKTEKSTSLTAKVKKITGVEGYQFIIATDKKFKKNVQTYTTTKTSCKFKGLKKKNTYYIKVRAYKTDSTDTKIYGLYSKVKNVKIKK